MSREIKFRAWDKSLSELVPFESIYIELEDGCMSVYKQEWRDYGVDSIELDTNENNVVIMQFTGLRDKNGVEIYEGDIVMIDDFSVKQRVVWTGARISLASMPDKDDYEDLNMWEPHELEVIGNIYENPRWTEVTP